MRTRTLTFLLTLSVLCGCSFDSTFFPVDERSDDSNTANQKNILLMSADGHKIHHALIKPQSSPKATIFVFHGSGSTISNWAMLLTPLVEDGYQLFLMEYRGFGISEGDASHEAVALDAHRAFLYLIGREDVKNRPLLVLGQSYGGQLAINVAANYPEKVDVLITEGAFTSFRNIAVYSTPWIGKPFTWAFFLNPYSSTELIKEASMPKLIIHSQDDDIVPFFMGEELFDQASSQKEFWKIRGQHADALVDYPKEFVSKINKMAGLALN